MRTYKFIVLALPCLSTMALPAAPRAAESFAWLSGHWCTQRGDQFIDELWLPAKGDVAVGVSRTIEDGATRSVEFMRIETRDGVTSFVAALEGQPPTAFQLIDGGADRARFENSRHDFPTRVEYWRTTTGLHAEIGGRGVHGTEMTIRFEYSRCSD